MATTQVTRPITTISGLQDGSDGARLLNFYATQAINPRSSKVPVLLQSTPGFNVGVAVDHRVNPTDPFPALKGIMAAASPIYGEHIIAISEKKITFYSDIDAGTVHFQADMPANVSIEDNKPLRWATDGRYIVMVTEREVYAVDRKIVKANVDDDATNSIWVSVVAPVGDDDSDDTTTEAWVDVVWIDGYFILGNRGGQIFHSNLRSLQFDQLDFARADSKPDGIEALAAHNRRLYVFGTHSIESWFNAGLPDFAFARDNSFTQNVGIYKRESLAQNEHVLFFLGSDLSVYMMSGSSINRISNEIVDRIISDVARSSSYGDHTFPAFAYTEYAHKFYCINADIEDDPSASYWCYDMETGAWHERTGDSERNKWIVHCAPHRGKNYVLISTENNIREMSIKHYRGLLSGTYTREIILPIIDADFNRVRHHNIAVDLSYKGDETDVIETLLEWSDDNKKTFKGINRGFRQWMSTSRMRWNTLGVVDFTGRNYRLTVRGGNGELNIQGAYSTIEVVAD